MQSLRRINHKHEESTRGKHRNKDLGFESYSNCALSVPIVKPGDGKSACQFIDNVLKLFEGRKSCHDSDGGEVGGLTKITHEDLTRPWF